MNKKLTIYYDGACYLCDAEINLYRVKDKRELLNFVDISNSDFDAGKLGLDFEEINQYFHVQLPNGEFIKGLEAFREIWKRLPSYNWLYQFSSNGFINRLMRFFYKAFVKIRPYLPKKKNCDEGICQTRTMKG
jgi:predicted DCC family thiol-disulfide oxidoreductase YuxK